MGKTYAYMYKAYAFMLICLRQAARKARGQKRKGAEEQGSRKARFQKGKGPERQGARQARCQEGKGQHFHKSCGYFLESYTDFHLSP